MSEKIVDSEQQPVESKKPEDYFFRASAADFKKIPSSPIAYWLSPKMLNCYSHAENSLVEICDIREGINTGNNERFLRLWQEVSFSSIQSNCNCLEGFVLKWCPHRKGGSFRKWAGNMEYVMNWEGAGRDIHEFHKLPLSYNGAPVRGKAFFFKEALSWSRISSSKVSFRYHAAGSTYDSTAPSVFSQHEEMYYLLSFLNGKISSYLLRAVSPTLDFRITNMGRLPLLSIEDNIKCKLNGNTENLIELGLLEWDSYETSWDFTSLPLLQSDFRQATLKETYQKLRLHWFNMTMKMQQLEEENNRIFIEAYGLQDELSPDVPLKEITLTCNPHYRYGGDKTAVELESLLLADTMKEFISYAVGCMFGRYSLDKEGLILANQGETLADYLKQVPEPTFMPDDDNVIPVLDGEWFTDDVTERFRRFVKVTFGEEHYQENLAFIEQSIGKDIRKYFLKDFYADHVKRYKKRPIYWMFSSPKGSFNALIYMHRYQPTTASVVLNGYLREFRTKLIARKEHLEQVSISASVSQRDKTNALKEIEKLKKMIDELESWERDVLYPLAAEQIEIDLDDGVKVNYPKFGKALKKVVGLS